MSDLKTLGQLVDDLLYQLDRGEDIAPRLRECAAAYGHVVLEPVQKQHVAEFREDGWTIMHPLSCRPALFDCPVNRAGEQQLDEPPAELGRYVIELVDGRLVVGEKVDHA